MDITVLKSPNQYSFVGNSIVFELQTYLLDPIAVQLTVGEKVHDLVYYPFRRAINQYFVRFDLADYISSDSSIEIPEGQIITPVADFGLQYRVKIGNDYQFDGIALRGGISNYAYRLLEKQGYDIFTYRLASYFSQFLFTTRTNEKEIRLKETELFPFVFIHPGVPIIFKSASGDEVSTPAQPAGSFCTMDIRLVLPQLPPQTQWVEVCPDGEYAFHFSIRPGKVSEEKYLLRFRNSLGAFEMLEVTGKAMHTPELSEESLYETLTDFEFYEERRSRVKSKGIIEVETGYKERREFPFIMDMIQSDEIYFIYPNGNSFRCHVKADGVQYRHLMTEPTSIKLKIRQVTEEEFFTPDIDFSMDEFDRIFDETFDETFD